MRYRHSNTQNDALVIVAMNQVCSNVVEHNCRCVTLYSKVILNVNVVLFLLPHLIMPDPVHMIKQSICIAIMWKCSGGALYSFTSSTYPYTDPIMLRIVHSVLLNLVESTQMTQCTALINYALQLAYENNFKWVLYQLV